MDALWLDVIQLLALGAMLIGNTIWEVRIGYREWRQILHDGIIEDRKESP